MDTAVILLNAGGTHLATFSIGGIDMEVDVKEDKTMELRVLNLCFITIIKLLTKIIRVEFVS